MSSIWPLIELLATKGHNVTVAACLKPKVNNGSLVNLVYVPEMYELVKNAWGDNADVVQDRLEGKHFGKL